MHVGFNQYHLSYELTGQIPDLDVIAQAISDFPYVLWTVPNFRYKRAQELMHLTCGKIVEFNLNDSELVLWFQPIGLLGEKLVYEAGRATKPLRIQPLWHKDKAGVNTGLDAVVVNV